MTNNQRSRRQEDRVATEVGGRRNGGSGNQWARRNDVRTDTESIELKTTEKKQYILKVVDIKEAEKIALLDGREMVFGIDYANDNLSVVVITKDYYYDLRDR